MSTSGHIDTLYLGIIQDILNNGTLKGNRTGIRAITLPFLNLRYDMANGFPLLTTKKMGIKNIATELEGFIRGITSKKWYQDRGCHIWDEWCSPQQLPKEIVFMDKDGKETLGYISGAQKLEWQKENPDLGPLGYSHGWRNFGGSYKPLPFIWTGLDKTITIQDSEDDLVGLDIDGNFGRYIVISLDGKDKYHNKRYSVKFTKTGFSKSGLCKKQIEDGSVFDPYFPRIDNVACVGEYKGITDSATTKLLMNSWRQMIHRCYNEQHTAYPNYGANGVWVSNSWLIFANYLRDVIYNVRGWDNKRDNWTKYELDKDILGHGYYSVDTCIWASKQDNINHTRSNYYFDALGPDGTAYYDNIGLARFCKEHNLKVKTVEASIKNSTQTHSGWKFIRKNSLKTNKFVRGVDQLKTIVDTLNYTPSDRRMVCSAWDAPNVKNMALPPCHVLWNVVVVEDTINLGWHQRSCDSGYGIPYNIASYGLLLMLLAKESCLQPGILHATFADCHIYENQVEGLREQLTRTPKPAPTLSIDNWNGIFEWKATDVRLHNYESWPKLSLGDIAV